MSKIAIKHMTAAQARDEDIRIEREQDILRRQLARLDEELVRLQVLQSGWLKRSLNVTRRLTEIAKGSDHGDGETMTLADAYTKMSDRYVELTNKALAVYREKTVIYRQLDALSKRAKHVWNRRRATRLFTIRFDAPGPEPQAASTPMSKAASRGCWLPCVCSRTSALGISSWRWPGISSSKAIVTAALRHRSDSARMPALTSTLGGPAIASMKRPYMKSTKCTAPIGLRQINGQLRSGWTSITRKPKRR